MTKKLENKIQFLLNYYYDMEIKSIVEDLASSTIDFRLVKNIKYV